MNKDHTATRVSLILRLKNVDDVAAWDEFAAIYGPVVYRVAIGRGFQPADAENIVQEVFLAVANSISSWLERDDRGRFRAWLLRIARNAAVDMLTQRATRALGRDGSDAEAVLASMLAPSEFSSALDLEYERMVFRWAAAQVRESVEAHTWDAFWLTSMEGVTIEVAAERLKTRTGNIYFARSRVMSRIKQLVEQYEAER
ncbi:MAG: sigma-70 family RNA polymerase sigma factor [Planctomycetaceae bacterium]|nr:sigma-70 family RNA polymerase sigma factor [Planctomycetaceae bacterium]